ncbi:MAG: DUF4412 domain-containing protein [Pseudomonadota bacterium]
MYKTGISILALALAAPALADASIKMNNSADGPVTIHISGGKVAFSNGGQVGLIYDSKSDGLTMINHDQKGYVVIDEAAMTEISGQMDGMMKAAMAELEKMSPEEREMAMKMMPPQARKMLLGEKLKAAPISVSFSGDSDMIAGYSCKMASVSGLNGGTANVCVAKPNTIGLSDADYQTMNRAMEMMQKSAEQFGGGAMMPSASDLDGVAIKVAEGNGKVTMLESVDTKGIDSAIFEIPAGYSRQSYGQ